MKYLICVLVVVLGCQFTLAQVQSAASVRIETSINKVLSDFNLAMNNLNTTAYKTVNAEGAAFNLDAKTAIIGTVSTSTVVANVGVSETAVRFYEAVARVSAAITTVASNHNQYFTGEVLSSSIISMVENFRAKLVAPVSNIKEQIRLGMEANPKATACYDKALKDVTTLATGASKNITTSYTLAINSFIANAKSYRVYIKANTALITKGVATCIAKKPQEAVWLCLSQLLEQENVELEMITRSESEIRALYNQVVVGLTEKSDNIGAVINEKNDEILTNMTACASKIV